MLSGQCEYWSTQQRVFTTETADKPNLSLIFLKFFMTELIQQYFLRMQYVQLLHGCLSASCTVRPNNQP